LKVIQYNILDGCHDKDRLQLFSRWMKKQEYDVAGFNEVNNWTGEEFQEKAKEWGFPFSFLFEMKSSPYFVGIMSKFPVEVVNTDEKNFYHGLIHVKIQGIHFFVTHITPFGSEYRELETRRLAEFVSSIEDPVMVMGDLNTLSPLDKDHYDSVGMREKLIAKEKSLLQHTKNYEIDYIPMKNLLDAGLFDIGYDASFKHSIPTPLKHNLQYAKRLRIDYMLGNAAMMEYNPIAKVVCNEEVDVLSDHYPIESKWG